MKTLKSSKTCYLVLFLFCIVLNKSSNFIPLLNFEKYPFSRSQLKIQRRYCKCLFQENEETSGGYTCIL